jgi:hypothetical protein
LCRHMTAVYGGSSSVLLDVLVLGMYESKYLAFAVGKGLGDGIGIGPLATYVRWEYRPADRSSVLAALSRFRSPRVFRRIAFRSRRPSKAVRINAKRPHGVRRALRLSGNVVTGRTRHAVP